MEPVTVELVHEGSTKNTEKYSADPNWIIGNTIYVNRSWLRHSYGEPPARLVITLEEPPEDLQDNRKFSAV
jgi:hypothetical protein